ncbi:MAG: phosphate ABC transporter substrate-binding protein PstS [Asticcacaulis sp.]
MKTILTLTLAAVLMTSTAVAASADTISGAGSSFAAPLYAKWAEGWKRTSGNALNYQAIGSGGGIKQIEAKTVDFAGSDKPLTQDVLNQYGLYQFPTAIGGVVPMINIPGVAAGKLHLTGAVLADIYMGKITAWNDPAITKLNPGLAIPGLPITVVHRSDGSGTTFIFSTYLSQVSGEWKSKLGASDTVEWPVGLGGKGNDGVSAFVKQTAGSIGYVEYAYVMKTAANYALVQSHDGTWPAPKAPAFAAAAAGADWAHAPGNYLMITNQPGANAWPISGATFAILYKTDGDAAKRADVLKFFDYGFKTGDFNAADLQYVPMPAAVKTMIRQQWKQEISANGKPVYVSPNQ